MLIEFQAHPGGGVVAIDAAEVVSVVPARGGMPLTLLRLSGGRDVVVRGCKDEVAARLDLTLERPAFRDG